MDDAYVVRFNTFNPTIPQYRTERIACDLARACGLPVPAVVALDASRVIIPYDYLIMTRLPGVDLAASWRTLAPALARDLAWEAGLCLARLHAITFDSFGKLHTPGQFDSWPGYFADYSRRYLDTARRLNLLDTTTLARLAAVPGRAHDLLAAVRQPVLVHSDYHYENILQECGWLSGLLDFEWAIAGDPSYDFMNDDVRAAMIPGSEGAFLAGYRSLRPLDADHDRRVAVYRLFLRLETVVMHAERGNDVAMRDARCAREDARAPRCD